MLFTIVIPTLNRSRFLCSAIKSIVQQSYKNWELIIIDNCSNDNTKDIVQQFRDPRIRYHKFSRKVPISDNWERAFQYINGNYFITAGDDDYLLPNALTEVYQSIKNSPIIDFCVCNSSSYTQIDPVSGLNKVLFASDTKNCCSSINPFEISLLYQTFNTCKNSFNASQLHPSVFFIRTKLVRCIIKEYGRFYFEFFPDWIGHVLLGVSAKNAIYIDKNLVIIGGFDSKPYCFKNSKDKFFALKLLSDSEINSIMELKNLFPLLVKFFETYSIYPYFSGRIISQILLNMTYLKKFNIVSFNKLSKYMKIYEDDILIKLTDYLNSNYIYCLAYGDCKLKEFNSFMTFFL